MSFIICDAELHALQGQAHMNYCIYLYLRQFMDYATGITGIKRVVSYQSISEALYIEPRAGVKGGSPHKSTIRRALDQLEKGGLVRRKESEYSLIFKLLFAVADNNAQKKADTNPTHHPDTPKASNTKALKVEADTPKNKKADIHPLSDNNINISPPPKILPTIENQQAGAVEFSNIIKPEDQPAITGYLKSIPEDYQQIMLDDLTGYMVNKQAAGQPVKNPSGVMRRMLERYKSGQYVAELVAIGRKLRAAEKQTKTQAPKPQAAAEKAQPTQAQRDALNKFKTNRKV